jgi:hypothetical protein
MGLYSFEAQSRLKQASGQTSVQARVQNQYYQDAVQADAAVGANVLNRGWSSLAQLSNQTIDLSLLQGKVDARTPIDDAWIARNIRADRQIEFGSEEYFALAKDPAARQFMQSGVNVIFKHQGQVIAVQTTGVASNPTTAATSSSNFNVFDLFAWLGRVLQNALP